MARFSVREDCTIKKACAFAPPWDSCRTCTGRELSDDEVEAIRQGEIEIAKDRLDRIRELGAQGIVGRELCPEPEYWHWPILQPEKLPEEFKHFIRLGEVRF